MNMGSILPNIAIRVKLCIMLFLIMMKQQYTSIFVIISSAITFYAQKHGGAVASLDVIPFQARIANALVSYSSYILKMLYPSKLAVLYPHPGSFPWWHITGACFLLICVSLYAVRVIKERPYFIVGWLWYLGTLVPVIGLVQVGSQSMADRYTYIPLIGIFFIIYYVLHVYLIIVEDPKAVIYMFTGRDRKTNKR